jgi:predicted metal-binding membrane protein
MTEALLEVLLRRDRIIVAVALAALTALAWTDVLWLAADMGMGGMDMTGFRMIPAGIGIMAPALAPRAMVQAERQCSRRIAMEPTVPMNEQGRRLALRQTWYP